MTCPSRSFRNVAVRMTAWSIVAASAAHAQIAGRYVGAPPPVANAQVQGAGSLEGFVYWDTRAVTHNPAGACDGFSVTVIAGGHALVAGSGQFGAKYIGQVTGGNQAVYDVCAWAYDHVQENTPLSVQLAITQPSAFTGNVAATNPLVGPVTVINAQCNMLPDIATATAADLVAHSGSCQNMAFDLNFQLVPAAGNARVITAPPGTGMVLQRAPAAGGATSGPLLSPGAQPMLLGNGGAPGSAGTPPPSQPMIAPVANPNAPAVPVPSKGNSVNQYDAVTLQRGVTQQPGFSQWANGGGTGGANAGITDGTKNADGLNPQPYPPKGMTGPGAAGVSGNMPAVQSNLVVNGGKSGNMPAVQSNLVVNGGKSGNLALPANLQLFSGAEAKNPAALNLAIGSPLSQSGGGMLGPEQTMSAPGVAGNLISGTNPGPAAIATRPAPGGPAAMQPSKVNSLGLAAANNGRMVCTNTGITAVNGGKFTQFTPGTHYIITGCGFGSAPGKVYLSGPFPAHNGEVDLGPYWQYSEKRTWTGHWSDQVIDAQLDPALLGELDQYNISLVVQTSTGQQIQMTGVSFKAQRAEIMLGTVPASALGFDPHETAGAWGTPCSNWIKTSSCTVEVLRQFGGHGMANPPDTYNIKLKPGFVLSRVKVLVMGGPDEENIVQTDTPEINGNQIVMHWQWTTTSSTDSSGTAEYYSYSLYGLQIYVIGPLGVTDAWAAP